MYRQHLKKEAIVTGVGKARRKLLTCKQGKNTAGGTAYSFILVTHLKVGKASA